MTFSTKFQEGHRIDSHTRQTYIYQCNVVFVSSLAYGGPGGRGVLVVVLPHAVLAEDARPHEKLHVHLLLRPYDPVVLPHTVPA